MEINVRGEKLQFKINQEAAKISALLSGKIDKYEHLTSEEILPSGACHIAQQEITCCIIWLDQNVIFLHL